MVTGRIEIAREGWREDAAYSRGDSDEYTYNHAFVSDCFDGLAGDMEVKCVIHTEKFRVTVDA